MNELLEIESQNCDWFEAREPKSEDEEHDRLYYYYLLQYNGREINISFLESDLPKTIIDECMEVFRKYFPC